MIIMGLFIWRISFVVNIKYARTHIGNGANKIEKHGSANIYKEI